MAAPYQYSQYSPSQPYPQNQHYQHGQQYQQPQQHQQSYGNSYGGYQQQQQQYPSQQPSSQEYSPHNYQPNYPPQQQMQQQYPPSQYSTQQYAMSASPTQQYHAPHQSGYQQPQRSHSQSASHTNSQSCFNCGNLGHFAQDCPEPKRQVPAGALNPEQHRRQGIALPKHNGQIVTKFGPRGQATQGSPGSYTPTHSSGGYSSYAQPHAQTFTPSYTPTTPQNVASPAQSWPLQHQQHQQHQQHLQHQSSHHPAPPTPQQSWPTPRTPASAASFGTPQTNQASPSHSQHGFPIQNQQNYHGAAQIAPAPGATQTPISTQQTGQNLESALNDLKALQERSSTDDRFAAAEPTISPSALQEGPSKHEEHPQNEDPSEDEVSDEPQEDDLSLLDVPDLPPSTAQYGGAVVPLVGMPIPANFVVADALFPMDPPPPEAEGRCQSKYSRSFRAETLLQNIRESNYWKDLKDDVVFSTISIDGDFVLVDDCRSKLKDRQRPVEELHRESRSESRSVAPPKKEAAEAAKSLEQLQMALEQAKADIANREKKLKAKKSLQSPYEGHQSTNNEERLVKAEPMSPPQSASIENAPGYRDDSENLLASLGVTGTAKPVAPPSRLVSQNKSANGEAVSRSRSASKTEIADHHVSSSHHDHQQGRTPTHHHAFSAPPPPASHQRPHAQHSHSNEVHRSPPANGGNSFGRPSHRRESENTVYQYSTDQQSSYPPQMRSESFGSRKRGYDERSSSEESEEAARRQDDDITPKLKRRQPKVAEAYSRRW